MTIEEKLKDLGDIPADQQAKFEQSCIDQQAEFEQACIDSYKRVLDVIDETIPLLFQKDIDYLIEHLKEIKQNFNNDLPF